MSRLTKTKLVELCAANLPHMDASDIGAEIKEDCSLEDRQKALDTIAVINDYLKAFAREPQPGMCIGCGSQLGCKNGDIVGWLINQPTFTWGLAHGEGYCSKCGYPGRAIHYIDGDKIVLRMIFQYHPEDLVETQKPA